MQRHPTEPTVVLLELQFLPARPAQKYVINITRLLANEERGFLFLLALGHFVRTYLQQNCVLGHLGARIMGNGSISG